eukprot:gene21504-28486_t
MGIANSLDIYEFICKGPLLANCGVSPESIVAGLDEWLRVGKQLAVQLDMNHDDLNDVERLRIYQYYLPVYFWCREQITSHKASGNKNVMVLGISAPQGCGKSTLVEQLELLFKWAGGQAASVSVDDFYLSFKDQTALAAINPPNSLLLLCGNAGTHDLEQRTRTLAISNSSLTHAFRLQDQSALAASNPSNPLLELRGNAGTHDLALGTSTLEELRTLTEKGKSAAVPRYDKSANSGRGDRADPSTWPKLDGPLDVIFFEGWMSGFTPISDEEAAALDPSLPPVNACLRSYKEAWDSYVDSWLVVRIGDPQWVFGWRLQAEEKMRASGKPGMTNDQIADFVARFQVAYRAYLPGLYNNGPTTAKAGRLLTIQVDQNRTPVA